MKLLLVAATKLEIEPAIHHFGLEGDQICSQCHDIKLLITGVGMVATAYALGKELAASDYDLAINAGIAGSFDPSLKIGETVIVNEDHFAELGAENNEVFLPIDVMGFGESSVQPLKSEVKLNALKQVKAITVNTVHGNPKTIQSIIERLSPHIESMEGAAFFYSCSQAGLPSIQLRTVSNAVELRNTANWNIPLAINNLNYELIKLIESITQ
jgi:futalosine hydrolase